MAPETTRRKQRLAMAIVLAEERRRGWDATPVPSVQLEKQLGCDIQSTPPGGDSPHPVEVKGWGEPLLRPKGAFAYDQDIRPSQYEAAQNNPNYRLEIVANLDAALAETGQPQRLTLSASDIQQAYPSQYRVKLERLRESITEVEPSALAEAIATLGATPT